jgi:hypothetical protein
MRSDPSHPTRRAFVCAAGAFAATAGFGAAPLREATLARVIVDNDFAGDPDGLVALAHQLLAPRARCVLVTTSALDPELARLGGLPAGATAAAGRTAAMELLAQMGRSLPVFAGAERFGADAHNVSGAARAIVAEAMRDDPLPLFVACGGPLTNVAAALRLQPAIANRMTLVWIGGGGYPEGGREYNLATDPAAARQVVEGSGVPLWQVPETAYRQLQVSMAELLADIRPISPLAAWLCDRYETLPPFVRLAGAIGWGDGALPLLTAVSAESSSFHERPAASIAADFRYGRPVANRRVRVYDRLDARLALADLTARLRIAAGKNTTGIGEQS